MWTFDGSGLVRPASGVAGTARGLNVRVVSLRMVFRVSGLGL